MFQVTEGRNYTNKTVIYEWANPAVILDVFKHWNSVSGQHQNTTLGRQQESDKAGAVTSVMKE